MAARLVSSPATLGIDADLGRLAEVRRFVREQVARLGADDRAIRDVVQAVDEWVTNVVVHGYRGADGPITVTVAREGDGITVRIRDAAPVFDPATAPAFDPNLPLEHRPPGGMGIHLIRELADRFEHRALGGGGNEIAIQRTTTDHRGGNE